MDNIYMYLNHPAIRLIKRGMDIFVSIIYIPILLPVILFFGILVKIESRGPMLFKQKRVGINGNRFVIYKIRSMRIDKKDRGMKWTEKNDPRITRIGKVIRLKRIDEFPQLFNVIKGEMSIVGPRPERPYYVYKFSEVNSDYKKRLIVQPGLTGLAQINGGYNLTPAEKLELDLVYIENYSILLDCEIMLKTLKILFTCKGAR